MPNSIVAEYQSQLWIMEPGALKAFIERIGGLPASAQLPLVAVEIAPKELAVANGVARIGIKGVLLDTVPGWMRLWGFDVTGYDEIAAQVNAAASRKDVTSIQLEVDSPGGLVAGVMEASDAIYNARQNKSVNAVIRNLSASGAYWLTSQAQQIHAADANVLAGSIGVYTYYVDWTQHEEKLGVKVIVVRSGEHKGMGLDAVTEPQIAAVQQYIDATARNFIDAVAQGRGREAAKIAGLATGQLWIAAQARELGLVDSVIENRNQTTQTNQAITGDSNMDTTNNSNATAQVQTDQIRQAAQAEERKRLTDLKAAFPDDLSFATAAFEKGSTIAEAKAEYCDVLRERLKTQAKAPAVPASAAGAPPLAQDGSDAGNSQGDFLEQAEALAAEKKISMTAAMKQLRRRQPQLHEAFKARCESEGRAMYETAV